ncbi:hypothetical protein ACRARG_01505 [Pseudooceanicola sp. C21-150M6]|uniref:hypothetical protein n=1 Tax=Pseudooceanicola sp. C21-150M6 TaxID=3434355 RepID=UPI003D80002D
MKSLKLIASAAVLSAATTIPGAVFAKNGVGNANPNPNAYDHACPGPASFCPTSSVDPNGFSAPEIGAEGAVAALILVLGGIAVMAGNRGRSI